MRNCFFI